MKSSGWSGTLKEFLKVDSIIIVNELCKFIYNQDLENVKKNPIDNSTNLQIAAWFDSIEFLRREVSQINNIQAHLIFEYRLLREGGRRPDVLLLLPGELLVLEFKSYNRIHQSEFRQTSLYVRDLEQYHSTIQEFNITVRGALVLTNSKEQKNVIQINEHQIYQLAFGGVSQLVERIEKNLKEKDLIEIEDFLSGSYQPLPTIIESARAIMREEKLPYIKTLKSSNFDNVVQEVKNIVQYAKENKTHHLVLISGVPGAGKTFVGLTLAYDIDRAIYLSGNGPLVDVLQDSLENKSFVQSLYNYKMDYLHDKKVPNEQVIIFDEAQRAWDSKKMKINKSEPDVIIEIAKKQPWGVVIGLIGEGQEIHLGEEGGIGLWDTAIKDENIIVHAKHQQNTFTNAIIYYENKQLHLNTSLRTHKALKYFEWVEAFISGDFKTAGILAEKLKKERYLVKHVKSLREAKEYVEKLYSGSSKTYGIVVSSGIKKPKDLQVIPYSDRYADPKSHVAYFNYPDSLYYCKKLNYAATEFHIQGLELDMTIIYWGEDLKRVNGEWVVNHLKKDALNPIQMKLNAYRVLLTRGRDGIIIVNDGDF